MSAANMLPSRIEGLRIIPLRRIPDDREGSKTRGELQEVFFGVDNYCLVQVPPDTWNGFTTVGTETALIANACTHAHDPSRSSRLDPFENDIPYSWLVKNH
mgnify:CR=1 FL=1